MPSKSQMGANRRLDAEKKESSSEPKAHQLSVSVSRLLGRWRHLFSRQEGLCGISHACRARRAVDNRSGVHPWAFSSSQSSCGMFWFPQAAVLGKTSASQSPYLSVRPCLPLLLFTFEFFTTWWFFLFSVTNIGQSDPINLSVLCDV